WPGLHRIFINFRERVLTRVQVTTSAQARAGSVPGRPCTFHVVRAGLGWNHEVLLKPWPTPRGGGSTPVLFVLWPMRDSAHAQCCLEYRSTLPPDADRRLGYPRTDRGWVQ